MGIDGNPEFAPVPPIELRNETIDHALFRQDLLQPLPVFGMNVELLPDIGDGVDHLLLGIVAEHPVKGRVHVQIASFGRGPVYSLDGVFIDLAILLFTGDPFLLGHPKLGNILRYPQKIKRLLLFIHDGDLLRMEDPRSQIPGFDGFVANVHQGLPGEGLPILGGKKIRLLPGEKIVIVFADQIVPANSQQFFPGPVEPDKVQGFCVLDKDHVGDVLDDAGQKLLLLPQLLLLGPQLLIHGFEIQDLLLQLAAQGFVVAAEKFHLLLQRCQHR
ncbi:MAG: hypothetical protein BWZ01_02909 [Deltaproteobacteria bacterium ADurb.BinA179]|nr:MAG: hypothetical protein BWZ01_02909 [Deltaproteobacteria bacterium ADurb.BinA179]